MSAIGTLERDELAGLKRLQKEQEPTAAYVFVNERAQPFGRGYRQNDQESW